MVLIIIIIMFIKKYTLGELQTNCYLVYDEKTKEGIVIDPADDANYISEQILSLNIIPKCIIATHGHYDHILAAWELQLAFNIPFLIHKDDLFLVKNLNKSASHWSGRKIIERAPERIDFLFCHSESRQRRDEESRRVFTQRDPSPVKLAQDDVFQIIHTPGHTPGSVCLYSKENKIIFCGDTIFNHSVGRTDLSYSSSLQLNQSVEKIQKVCRGFVAYPGHGESFII